MDLLALLSLIEALLSLILWQLSIWQSCLDIHIIHLDALLIQLLLQLNHGIFQNSPYLGIIRMEGSCYAPVAINGHLQAQLSQMLRIQLNNHFSISAPLQQLGLLYNLLWHIVVFLGLICLPGLACALDIVALATIQYLLEAYGLNIILSCSIFLSFIPRQHHIKGSLPYHLAGLLLSLAVSHGLLAAVFFSSSKSLLSLCRFHNLYRTCQISQLAHIHSISCRQSILCIH